MAGARLRIAGLPCRPGVTVIVCRNPVDGLDRRCGYAVNRRCHALVATGSLIHRAASRARLGDGYRPASATATAPPPATATAPPPATATAPPPATATALVKLPKNKTEVPPCQLLLTHAPPSVTSFISMPSPHSV